MTSPDSLADVARRLRNLEQRFLYMRRQQRTGATRDWREGGG